MMMRFICVLDRDWMYDDEIHIFTGSGLDVYDDNNNIMMVILCNIMYVNPGD